MLAKVVGNLPPCIPGGDPHATSPILLASQGARGDQAVPSQGGSFRTHLQSPPRLNTPAARPDPNEAWDAAPTPQLQSAQILHPPRNPPAPRSQPQMTRQSLQRPTTFASMAACLLPLQGQPDANEEIFTWRTLAQSTSPLLSAPACFTASAA